MRLAHLLANEPAIKTAAEDVYTRLFRDMQKAELLGGFVKTYQPKDAENGQNLPPEGKLVQVQASRVVDVLVESWAGIFDTESMKDATNCDAKADVIVDGVVLAANIPATALLWMRDRLKTLEDFAKRLPQLDPTEEWHYDPASGLQVTNTQESMRAQKITEFVTASPATQQHPAQIREVSKDVFVGTWTTVKKSGALTADRIREIQTRLTKLQTAVKNALADANTTQVVPLRTSPLLRWVFQAQQSSPK